MSNRDIELDQFSAELTGMLDDVVAVATGSLRTSVRAGLRKGASEWVSNAREQFPDGQEYKRSGMKFKIGAYAKSVRWHMTSNSDSMPSGEIGCPKMPGLPHLLENGHATVGGGRRVLGREHIAPAAEVAFTYAFSDLDDRIEKGLSR